ncbi:hypothetical protein [Enterococcus larvae]|uniref:hypothetical protein n=1 Tax=Enterococcus larvae TaxID=2794352 RepID=UPI003F36A216
MNTVQKFVRSLFGTEDKTPEKEPWVEYLEGKIAFNKDLIKEVSAQRMTYKEKQAEQEKAGEQFGINYAMSIQNADAIIRSAELEITGWEAEIRTGKFKGYY